MAGTILGVDLKHDSVNIIESELSPAGALVPIRYQSTVITGGHTKDSLTAAVKECIKSGNFKSRTAMVAVPASDVMSSLIKIPKMPEKEIPLAIKLTAESTLKFSPDKTVLKYFKLNIGNQEDQNFYVLSAQKEKMKFIADAFKDAGVKIKEIIPSTTALSNILHGQEDGPVVIMHIARRSTTLVLMVKGTVVLSREVGLGGDNITQSMVGTFLTPGSRIELDYDTAEEIKTRYGIPDDFDEYEKETGLSASEILSLIRPVLEKLGAEIQRTFEYFRQETSSSTVFNKIYVTGNGANMKNILTYFEAQMGITVREMPFYMNTDPEDIPLLQGLSIAYGAVSASNTGMNMLPQEMVDPVRYYLQLVPLPAYAAALVLLGMLGSYLPFSAAEKSIKNELKTYEARKNEINANNRLNALTLGLFAKMTGPGENDVLVQMMNELDKKTPDIMFFNAIDYKSAEKKAILRGVLLKGGTKSAISEFIMKLSKNKLFSSIDISYIREAKKPRSAVYEFEIQTVLGGGL